MEFAQIHALAAATPHLGRRRASSGNTMPDKGVGWRKKIQGGPKDMPPLKTGGDDTAAADDSSDRRRHHGWRKTRHESRPGTPVSGALITSAIEDAEDTRSERSEVSTPRRNSKPKLARYTSLFNSFKETSKPEFTQPWSSDAPPPFQPYIDPLDALQSIRSHMMTYPSKPVSLEHNNGLFRIFEDYGKVREEKEHLEALLLDTFEDWKIAEEQWRESEGRYEAEIRRLDLLIARGTSGMAGLIEARQGSVVDRKPRHRNTMSNNMYESLSQEQLDNEIKLRTQRVILHRPKSPSGKMIALSKQFANTTVDLPIGNPPDEDKKTTLSRKVQSEVNLSTVGRTDFSQSLTNSVNSGFSGSVGDALPDEMIASTSAVDCDAFLALRELGALVARRRCLKVDDFIESLMMLLSTASGADTQSRFLEKRDSHPCSSNTNSGEAGQASIEESLTPRRTLRRFQSQPQLSSDQRRRRHFSFEPGDDQLDDVEEVLKPHEAQHGESDASDVDSRPSARLRDGRVDLPLIDSNPPANTLFVDFQKPSKIPSPVQSLGRVRRENSASSLQTISGRGQDERRDSHSSILTAFRERSSGSLRLDSRHVSENGGEG